MDFADRIRVVLVRPALAANVGAVARIMRNFGLRKLCLVQPECDPRDAQARAVATHGEDLLEQAALCDDFTTAVAECGLVAGTSARLGGLLRSHQVVSPREFAPQARTAATHTPIALVFGPERTGLLNEEVVRCHWLMSIPAAADFPVLNLAQAVAICLYELHNAGVEAASEPAQAVAPFIEQERAFAHLEKALTAIHFLWNEKAPAQMHALRHLLGRAEPSPMEIDLLHGLARQILWHVEHHPRAAGVNPPSTAAITADESGPTSAS